MRNAIVLGLSALLIAGLAGCGKDEKKQQQQLPIKLPIAIKDEGVNATLGGGRLPKDAPAFVKLYPGAEVMAVVKNVGGPGSAMITFSTGDSIKTVVDFYTKLGEENGLTVASDKLDLGTRYVRLVKGGQRLSLALRKYRPGEVHVDLTYRKE